MSDEKWESNTGSSKPSQPPTKTLTFKEAIEMGEYKPEYLATYPEWHTFSKHTQLQYIRQAIDNRRNQLLTQWAEINNVIDFRNKPRMQEALTNLEGQMKQVESDREDLYLEYTT